MSYYRVYHLSENGSIHAFDEIECEGDGAALDFARDKIDGGPVEVWNQDRKVATLGADGAAIEPVRSSRARAAG